MSSVLFQPPPAKNKTMRSVRLGLSGFVENIAGIADYTRSTALWERKNNRNAAKTQTCVLGSHRSSVLIQTGQTATAYRTFPGSLPPYYHVTLADSVTLGFNGDKLRHIKSYNFDCCRSWCPGRPSDHSNLLQTARMWPHCPIPLHGWR